jgi:acyl-CoA thioesterase-1
MRNLVLLVLLLLPSVWGKNIVILGDSLTAGYGVSKELAYPHLLQRKMVKDFPSIKIIPSAISGSTTASAFRRTKWVFKQKIDLFILALGANDILRGITPKSAYQNLSKTIEFAQSKKVEILLVEMKTPPNYGKEFSREFEEVFKDLAKKYKLKTIPFDIFLGPVAGIKKYNQADGIHPNEEGHALIADKMKDFLVPYLSKLGWK